MVNFSFTTFILDFIYVVAGWGREIRIRSSDDTQNGTVDHDYIEMEITLHYAI